MLHGATFLSLKTTGEVRERARAIARAADRRARGARVLVFGVWTQVMIDQGAFPGCPAVVGGAGVVAAGVAALASAAKDGRSR